MRLTGWLSGVLIILTVLTEMTQAVDNIDSILGDFSKDPYNFQDYRNHSCIRTCTKDSPPMTCKYYFLLEHYNTMSSACHGCPSRQADCFLPQCVHADGNTRGVLTANRMIPGPAINVCEGDTIVVVVDNRMELGEGTSIHWHGLRQIGTQHMDGANLVTQCPINTWNKMTYRFKAADPGTYFWHSHSSIQRSDGLYGGLVIRTPHDLDPHRHMYDYDLPEHYIVLTEWCTNTAGEAFSQEFHGVKRAEISGILINGLGSSNGGPTMPYPEFTVKAGSQYRFRVAYNGIFNCPLYITIDGHTLLMIATDGHNFEPLEVDGFTIFSGERYDFILRTKHEVKENFWMRFKGQDRCDDSVFQAAILRYDGASHSHPEEQATFHKTVERAGERILNGLSGISSNTSFQVADLQVLGSDPDPHVLIKEADKKFYISIAASKLEDTRFKTPPHPSISTQKPPSIRPVNQQFNYISSLLPPSPPLTQFQDIPQDYFCNNSTVTKDCTKELCKCVHMLSFDLGDIVEIVLVSFTNTVIHPIHMHGYSFRIVAMRSFDRSLTVEEVKVLEKKGQIPRSSRAPLKDTIPVSPQSVAIMRFRANNPGFWFFHCHIEFHAELGMALILQAGRPSQMPKPPKGFPTCGSWRPEPQRGILTAGKQRATVAENSEGHSKIVGAVIGSSLATVLVVILLFVIRIKCCRKKKGICMSLANRDSEKYRTFT